jgi:hypothetical protein
MRGDPYLPGGCTDADIDRHFGEADEPEPEEEEECSYCGYLVPVRSTVPDLDDDEMWEQLLDHHGDDCEWVLTRAHRTNERHA